MKEIFVLVVGLIIFSVTNFANAAHYWIGSNQFEAITTNIYIDTDKIGVVYLNDGKLFFSKNKNIIDSKGVLFKVGCVYVDKNEMTKKQYNRRETLYFYRGINYTGTTLFDAVNLFNSYSVFNDFEIKDVIDKLTYDCDETEAGDPGWSENIDGINALNFKSDSKTYSKFFVPNDYLIYKKARELFGVQNNYRSDKIQQLLDRNKNVQKIPSLGWSIEDFDNFAKMINVHYDQGFFINYYDFRSKNPSMEVEAYFRNSDFATKIFQSQCIRITLVAINENVTENDLIIKLFPRDTKITFADKDKIFGKSNWLARVYPECGGDFVFYVSDRENSHPIIASMFGFKR